VETNVTNSKAKHSQQVH